METDDWLWICDLANYPLIQVFQFFAILVCWELLVRLTAMKIEPRWHGQDFHLVFVECFDERCYIPSLIYCTNLWSQLIAFIAQSTILFQFAIQISVWARIIMYENMMVKSGIFLSKTLICGECSQTRTWPDMCFADVMGLSAPGLNPCVPPGGVRGIEFCGACRWRNQQWRGNCIFLSTICGGK
jgi:hypothetical protein